MKPVPAILTAQLLFLISVCPSVAHAGPKNHRPSGATTDPVTVQKMLQEFEIAPFYRPLGAATTCFWTIDLAKLKASPAWSGIAPLPLSLDNAFAILEKTTTFKELKEKNMHLVSARLSKTRVEPRWVYEFLYDYDYGESSYDGPTPGKALMIVLMNGEALLPASLIDNQVLRECEQLGGKFREERDWRPVPSLGKTAAK